MESGNSTMLVVTEQTGQLPASIERLMPGPAGVTIVSQSIGESAATFAERVMKRIARLPLRERPKVAVICCGRLMDEASWDARARVANSLLSALSEGGELILSADDKAGRRSLPRFLELVAGLGRRCSDTRTVHLRFDPLPSVAAREHMQRSVVRRPEPWRLTG